MQELCNALDVLQLYFIYSENAFCDIQYSDLYLNENVLQNLNEDFIKFRSVMVGGLPHWLLT